MWKGYDGRKVGLQVASLRKGKVNREHEDEKSLKQLRVVCIKMVMMVMTME